METGKEGLVVVAGEVETGRGEIVVLAIELTDIVERETVHIVGDGEDPEGVVGSEEREIELIASHHSRFLPTFEELLAPFFAIDPELLLGESGLGEHLVEKREEIVGILAKDIESERGVIGRTIGFESDAPKIEELGDLDSGATERALAEEGVAGMCHQGIGLEGGAGREDTIDAKDVDRRGGESFYCHRTEEMVG